MVSCSSDKAVESEKRGFSAKKFESLNKQGQYDYDRVISDHSNPVLDFFFSIFEFLFKFFSNGFAFTILIVGLLVILVVFIRKGKSGLLKPIPENESITELTVDDLENTDYQKLLDIALANSDLRLATRYTFLIALQFLQINKKINWQKEKTNQEYLQELNAELQAPFSALIRAYEYVWYGEMKINIHVYHRVKEYFLHLKKLGS